MALAATASATLRGQIRFVAIGGHNIRFVAGEEAKLYVIAYVGGVVIFPVEILHFDVCPQSWDEPFSRANKQPDSWQRGIGWRILSAIVGLFGLIQSVDDNREWLWSTSQIAHEIVGVLRGDAGAVLIARTISAVVFPFA